MKTHVLRLSLVASVVFGMLNSAVAEVDVQHDSWVTRYPRVIAEIPPYGGDMAELNTETNRLYYGWEGSQQLAFLDTTENKHPEVLTLGDGVLKVVAWETAKKVVFWTSSSVEFLDAKTHEFLGEIGDWNSQPGEDHHMGFELNERDGLVYGVKFVHDTGDPVYGCFVLHVYDANTMEYLSQTALGGWFEEFTSVETEFDVTTNRLFVAEYSQGTVWQIDGETFEVLWQTDVQSNPTDLLVNPRLRKLYVVGNSWGHTVVVDIFDIDGPDSMVSKTLEGDNAEMVLHHSSGRVFMIVGGFAPSDGRLYLLDGCSDSLLTTVYGPISWHIDINQRTGRIYTGNGEIGGVNVISAWRPRIVATVQLDVHVGFIKVNPINQLVYVSQRPNSPIMFTLLL